MHALELRSRADTRICMHAIYDGCWSFVVGQVDEGLDPPIGNAAPRAGTRAPTSRSYLILAGARDSGWKSAGGGLFPEILRSELHGVRATIEAYSKRATIAGFDQSTACGLRVDDKSDTVVRTTTRTGSRFAYRIDRWE
jgi:hypothetical protein